MAMSTEDKRKGILAKIHLAKKELAMEDDTYRAMLLHLTGKTSCADVDFIQLQRIMTHMEKLGFKATRQSIGQKPLHEITKTPKINKIAVLLAKSGKSWAYADGMAKRMFKKERVGFLNDGELSKLIAALNYHTLKEQSRPAKTFRVTVLSPQPPSHAR